MEWWERLAEEISAGAEGYSLSGFARVHQFTFVRENKTPAPSPKEPVFDRINVFVRERAQGQHESGAKFEAVTDILLERANIPQTFDPSGSGDTLEEALKECVLNVLSPGKVVRKAFH